VSTGQIRIVKLKLSLCLINYILCNEKVQRAVGIRPSDWLQAG
jgi:hypothetical protein